MSRLIDADALKDRLSKHGEGTALGYKAAIDTAIMFVDEAEIIATDINVPNNGWVSALKDKLPESGKHVLVTCEIRSLHGYKDRYVCEAYYAKEHSVSVGRCLEDTDCYDYNEEDDEYYLKEGWYEVIHNWDEYDSVIIGDFVTHWMPIPELPKEEQNEAD